MNRKDVIKKLNEVGIYEEHGEQYIVVVELEDKWLIVIDGTFTIKKDGDKK